MDQIERNNPTPTPRLYWKQLFQISMNYGAKLGLLFVVQAAALLLFNTGAFASILYAIALVAVPVVLVIFANRYRDQYLDGRIRYMHAVSFMLWTYLFATIIAGVAFYVAFYLLFQNPHFLQTLEESMHLVTTLFNDDPEVQEQTINAFGRLSPKNATVQMIPTSLFFGMIYIYIAAIFVKRS